MDQSSTRIHTRVHPLFPIPIRYREEYFRLQDSVFPYRGRDIIWQRDNRNQRLLGDHTIRRHYCRVKRTSYTITE